MPADAFRAYHEHYQRMLNPRPDWAAAEADPARFACRQPWLPSDRAARILDFGCGWGHLLLRLWCAGYRRLEGVELVPEQAKTAQDGVAGRFPVHCQDGSSFLADRVGAYDLIVLYDVLEHVPPTHAPELLERLHRALAPDGRLVLRVPNMASALAPYSRYMDSTHVVGHTEFSIQQLLDAAGFTDHRIVADRWGVALSTWRPWAPLRGLGARGAANHALHRLLYWLRGQYPRPTVFGYNLEVYSRKA